MRWQGPDGAFGGDEAVEPAFRAGQVFAFIRRNVGRYLLMVVIPVGGTHFVSGGFSVSFQFGSVATDGSGIVDAPSVATAILGAVATGLTAPRLRCDRAQMSGLLCWHERGEASYVG